MKQYEGLPVSLSFEFEAIRYRPEKMTYDVPSLRLTKLLQCELIRIGA